MAKKPLSDKLVVKTFEYDGFDPDLKGKLICLMGEINRAKTQHVKAALLMGEAISTANTLLADHSKHGRFGEWVEKECGVGRATAHNYMHAWERFGKCEHVDFFDDHAMYALAAPSVPKIASIEAEKLAKKGIRITIEKAKDLIRSMAPAKPAKESPAADKSGCSPGKQPSAAPEENHTESPTSSKEPETAEPPLSETPDEDFDTAAIEAAPAGTIDVENLASPYRAAVRQLNALASEFEGIAADPKLGVHLGDKITRLSGYLRDAKETISQMEPVCACESCDGAGCNTCFGSGFWTRAVKGSRKR